MIDLQTKRHSLSHVMSQAVHSLFPDIKILRWVGPAIDDGFYQDYDFGDFQLTEEHLKDIEKKMKQIIKQNQLFTMTTRPIDEGIDAFRNTGDIYKLELAEDLKKAGETVLSYCVNTMQDGRVTMDDMCKWPHVEKTSQLDENSFKVDRIAGAYWRGDSNNKQLTRIYGYAFENRADLDAHIKNIEEAKKRDHRLLWDKLELFAFDDEVGPGLPLWLPAGASMVEEIEKLAKEREEAYGYSRVRSAHIAKGKLYERSGHLPYYADSMFPPMELDGEKYYLKAMNCPHHHKMYGAYPKSYRDLPIRYAEYWHCYRFEDSGSLFGLMRVRSLCMNDAHIYCTEEQFEEEFMKVIQMYIEYFKLFGIEKFQMRLSKHSKDGLGKKYVNHPELRIKTEGLVRDVLIKSWVPFIEAEDEAAFYGPKIDVQIWSIIGREFTLATNQLDFAVPERFNLVYNDKDGTQKTPICIHRAPLSTHERLIGFLIEHFAGTFPLWLSPRQVIVVPVGEKFNDYAHSVVKKLRENHVRVTIDDSDDSLNKKVRNAEKMHINYILVVGEKEAADWTVAVRNYKSKEQTVELLEKFVKDIEEEIKERKL
jgi:threonyl-tRNA synthetase